MKPGKTDDAIDPSSGLRKSLGPIDGIAILVGITIGAGIYSTPQIIAQYQTSFLNIIGLWILAGTFVFVGGLIYAELGMRLPNTGGEYVYISRAFGPVAGFIFGWAQLFIVRTSPAAGLAIVFVDYLQTFVILAPFARSAISVSLILAIGVLNYVGIRQASLFQIFSTVVKVGGVVVLVAAGLILLQDQTSLLAEQASVDAGSSPFQRLAATMMLVVFCFLGWDRVGYAAGEMKNPRRTIAISMFWGIGIVIVVYLLANFLYHYTLGMEGVRQSKRVAVDTATVLFGATGATLVAVIVMISAAGSINGTMMTATRVYYAMAHDGLFPKWFDHVHPRFRTPTRAIMAHCVWAIVLLMVRSGFESIVAGMTFAVLIFYSVTTLAWFRLRRQGVGGTDIPGIPLVLPCIFLAGLVSLTLLRGYFEWQKSLVDLAFVATGIPFAFYFCAKKSVPNKPDQPE